MEDAKSSWEDEVTGFDFSPLPTSLLRGALKTNALQADKCLNRSLYLVVRCILALQICLIID